ncbi:MAG: prepilin-type N-terminal cleavage/methylation domain-containing protein [Acidobacteriota bacterium]
MTLRSCERGMRVRRSEAGMTLRRREGGMTLMEMMVVVFLIALLAAISFPAVTSGIDSLRMRQATDTISSVLNQCLQRAEREQTPVELTFDRIDNALYVSGVRPGPAKRIPLPAGVTMSAILPISPMGDEPRRMILLMPGAAVPRIGVLLVNAKRQQRIVSVDPITGVPVVTTPGPGVYQ